MQQPASTTLRRRIFLGGSFLPNTADPVTFPKGDGTPVRTDVGTFTVTLDKLYPDFDTIVGQFGTDAGDQAIARLRAATVGGVSVITITIRDLSGGALADVSGSRISWMAIASNRA